MYVRNTMVGTVKREQGRSHGETKTLVRLKMKKMSPWNTSEVKQKKKPCMDGPRAPHSQRSNPAQKD